MTNKGIKGGNLGGSVDPSNATVGVPSPFKLEGGLNIGREKGLTRSYEEKVCRICANEQVVDGDTTFNPIRVLTETSSIIIIPYSLYLHLKECGCKEDEIKGIAARNYPHLAEIQAKHGNRGGDMPCKDGRVGYKFEIYLNYCRNVHCWVIPGDMEGKYAYRLSFAGKKGAC